MIDKVYKNLVGVNDLEVWTPDVVFTAWFYAIDEDHNTREPLGIIVFKEWTNHVVCYHGAMYKKHRGSKTPAYLKECLEIVRKQLDCKFVTTVPESNLLARRLNKALGMKLKTIIPEGYRTKDGFSDLLLYSEQ